METLKRKDEIYLIGRVPVFGEKASIEIWKRPIEEMADDLTRREWIVFLIGQNCNSPILGLVGTV
ncbi:hypothetical protein Gohar_000044, partial [Gossypium harknessii]|nr:hypothetical protein [Gossypium harknessii]